MSRFNMLLVLKTKYEYSFMHDRDDIVLSFYLYGLFLKKIRPFCIFLLMVAKSYSTYLYSPF